MKAVLITILAMSALSLMFVNSSYEVGLNNGKVQMCQSLGKVYVLPPYSNESCWTTEEIETYQSQNQNQIQIEFEGFKTI